MTLTNPWYDLRIRPAPPVLHLAVQLISLCYLLVSLDIISIRIINSYRLPTFYRLTKG